jgi:hypothetical protein
LGAASTERREATKFSGAYSPFHVAAPGDGRTPKEARAVHDGECGNSARRFMFHQGLQGEVNHISRRKARKDWVLKFGARVSDFSDSIFLTFSDLFCEGHFGFAEMID